MKYLGFGHSVGTQTEEKSVFPLQFSTDSLPSARDLCWGTSPELSRCPTLLPLLCPCRAGRVSTDPRGVRGWVWGRQPHIIDLFPAPLPPSAAQPLQPLARCYNGSFFSSPNATFEQLGKPWDRARIYDFKFSVPHRLHCATVMVSSKYC